MADRWDRIATAAIAALFLFYFASTRLPLDQDLGSKAAKVESLSKLSALASPLHEPLYYREAYFSFYYQVQALVHRVLPGSALASMGYSAAFYGVVYLVALTAYLQELAGIGPWWSLFLFLNTPALVVNFLYGNEASLSMALVAVAVALISLRRGLTYDVSAGLLLGLAFFCRPDVILMAPFVILLLATDGAALQFDWRRTFATGFSALITAFSYWALVVRSIPAEAAFPWIIDWRIFAVYLFFGFGPLVVALATFGFFQQSKKRWLLPLSSGVPLFVLFPRSRIAEIYSRFGLRNNALRGVGHCGVGSAIQAFGRRGSCVLLVLLNNAIRRFWTITRWPLGGAGWTWTRGVWIVFIVLPTHA